MSTKMAAARMNVRFRILAVGLQTDAASAATNAEKRIAFGPPIQLSNGTSATHARAPPARSAPYSRGMRDASRANMTEHSRPVKKKGSAEQPYIAVSRRKFPPV